VNTHQGWKDWAEGLTKRTDEKYVNPYSVTAADVLYLCNTIGYLERFIYVLGVILWAKKYGCNLLRFNRKPGRYHVDSNFRTFISLERFFHVFGSIHMHRKVLMANKQEVGGNWNEMLDVLDRLETKMCQEFAVAKHSLPGLRPAWVRQAVPVSRVRQFYHSKPAQGADVRHQSDISHVGSHQRQTIHHVTHDTVGEITKGYSMFRLSPFEDTLLQCGRWLFCNVGLRAIGWLAFFGFVYWFYTRISSQPTGQHTDTLYDPARLHDMLIHFASASPPSGQRGENRHKTEQLCRRILEKTLGVPLPKVRPKWLVNPSTQRCLELDMHNQEMRLAFEYDGAQHDVFTPHFHANEHQFEYRRLLDKLKSELCKDAGVTLIRIPWSEVCFSDPVRTARFLERLLYTHGLPFRSILPPVSVTRANANVDPRKNGRKPIPGRSPDSCRPSPPFPATTV
jgi:hypothetical protein